MDQDQKTKGQTTHDAEEDPRNRDIKIYVNGEIVPPRRGEGVGL